VKRVTESHPNNRDQRNTNHARGYALTMRRRTAAGPCACLRDLFLPRWIPHPKNET